MRSPQFQTGCHFTLCKIHQNKGLSASDPEFWWHQHMKRFCVPQWNQLPGISEWYSFCSYIPTPCFSGDTLEKTASAMQRGMGNYSNRVLLVPDRNVSFFLSTLESEMGNYERHLSMQLQFSNWLKNQNRNTKFNF